MDDNFNSPDFNGMPRLITEDVAARFFVKVYAKRIRYDAENGWHIWAESRWKASKGDVIELIRALCRGLSKDRDEKTRERLGKASFINSVERLARTDALVTVASSDWDKDPWLLGTQLGTIDLRTGERRLSKPEDMIKKLTAVSPSESELCPTWLKFLEQATGGDKEVIGFLRARPEKG